MSPRDTRTGGVLENMILPALKRGGYEYGSQVNIGTRLGVGRHLIDVVAKKDKKKYLASLKWQQTGGTAEQKVPFEIICLADALKESSDYRKAYLVLGGAGWTLRDLYVSGGLNNYFRNCERVEVINLEKFVAKANRGRL